jgi:hypothetical protein
VAKRGNVGGADVSREGVQRDLLPLIRRLHGWATWAWSRPTYPVHSPPVPST